jgi:HEAT repeat protein
MVKNDFNELARTLTVNPVPHVRKYAAISLGELGDRRAIDYLVKALNDENTEVRIASVTSLKKLGDETFIDRLVESLKDSDEYEREQTVQVLMNLGEKAVKPLINILTSDNWTLPYIAVKTLGLIGTPEAIRALIDLLEDEGNISVQKASIEAIENIGIESETELLKAFDNEYWYVKEKILNILSKTGGEKSIEKLNKTIEKEFDGRLKKHMEECIKNIQFRIKG